MEKRNTIDMTRPLLDMRIYPDYETVQDILSIFSERYDFISVSSLGQTILGKTIYCVNIGDVSAEKELFYVAAHHATEWMTTLILLKFINEYCEYYRSAEKVFGISINKLFNERCIHIIPLLNADGVDLHLHGDGGCILRDRLRRMSGGDYTGWQANARGVDLNHNYDAGFYEYKVLAGTKGIEAGRTRYCGEYPESEPESGAVANYLRFNEKIEALVTLHSQGELIYCSSEGKCPESIRNIGKQIEKLTGYTLSVPEGLASYGGLTDWFIKEMNKPAFTIECGLGENPLPLSDFHKIYSELRRMLFLLPFMI